MPEYQPALTARSSYGGMSMQGGQCTPTDIKDTTRIPAGLRGDEAGLEGRGYPRDGLANLLTIKPAWLARGDRSNQVRCVVAKPCQEELVLRRSASLG
jgi:hypothetical protein